MKTLSILAVTLTTALALPASAGAASATVTGDNGETIALPVQIRNMSPVVVPAFSAEEKRYTIRILGPDGSTEASLGLRCAATSATDPQNVSYLGNGTYTVQIQTTTDENDFSCSALGPLQVYTLVIAASTSITAPGATLPLRKLGDAQAIEHEFRLAPNPGAEGYVVAFARDAKLGADGSILGNPLIESSNTSVSNVGIDFPGPGRYTLVARTNRGNAQSGWSAPVVVTVVAPFDFDDGPFLRDSRGPGYEIRGRVREPSAIGARIVVSIARGKGAYKRLVTTKVRADRTIRIRFKQQRRGRYRLRYAFKGSSTVTAGTVVQNATLY